MELNKPLSLFETAAVSVDLSGKGLRDPSEVHFMLQRNPQIRYLDLSRNRLRNAEPLLKHIERGVEILLHHNPICNGGYYVAAMTVPELDVSGFDPFFVPESQVQRLIMDSFTLDHFSFCSNPGAPAFWAVPLTQWECDELNRLSPRIHFHPLNTRPSKGHNTPFEICTGQGVEEALRKNVPLVFAKGYVPPTSPSWGIWSTSQSRLVCEYPSQPPPIEDQLLVAHPQIVMPFTVKSKEAFKNPIIQYPGRLLENATRINNRLVQRELDALLPICYPDITRLLCAYLKRESLWSRIKDSAECLTDGEMVQLRHPARPLSVLFEEELDPKWAYQTLVVKGMKRGPIFSNLHTVRVMGPLSRSAYKRIKNAERIEIYKDTCQNLPIHHYQTIIVYSKYVCIPSGIRAKRLEIYSPNYTIQANSFFNVLKVTAPGTIENITCGHLIAPNCPPSWIPDLGQTATTLNQGPLSAMLQCPGDLIAPPTPFAPIESGDRSVNLCCGSCTPRITYAGPTRYLHCGAKRARDPAPLCARPGAESPRPSSRLRRTD